MHGKTMREALQEARDYRDDTNEGGPGSGPQKGGKKQSSADIKKAYGILNDPRFKQGNYSGAAKAIDKLSPGLSNHPDVKNAMKRANEESQITEKKAEFLRLDFKNKNEVEKLEGWMYKFISQVNAPYDSVVFNKHRLDGFSVEFEGMDDADALMTKLKRAGFRFKVDMRENLDLPATGDTTTSNASQELKEIVESIDDDTLIQIAESNGMGKLIVLDEDGNLANRDELLELAPLAVLATIARLAPAAVRVAKKAPSVIKKGISTAKDAITKYANKLDTPKAQPKPNLSKTDRAAVIPSRTNTGQKLDFSKSIKKQQKGFQKNLRKGIPNEQVEEIVDTTEGFDMGNIRPRDSMGKRLPFNKYPKPKAIKSLIPVPTMNYVGSKTEASFSKGQMDALVKGFGPLGGSERNKIKMDKVAGILKKLPKDALMQLSKANLPMVSKVAKAMTEGGPGSGPQKDDKKQSSAKRELKKRLAKYRDDDIEKGFFK